MLFGLLFSVISNAYAQNAEFNDLMYEAKALLKQKKCDDAEDVARDLMSDFSEEADSYLIKAKVQSCLKENPEDIYATYEKYLALDGSRSKISSDLSRLEKKLFSLEFSIKFNSEDVAVSVNDLEVSLVPMVIPGRKRLDAIELTPDGDTYKASGLVPGRYNIVVESNSRLIESFEKRIEGSTNKNIVEKITLPTIFDDFEKSIKLKDCGGAEKLLIKYSSYLPAEASTQWKVAEKLCRANRDNTVDLWLEAWETVQNENAVLTKEQETLFEKNIGNASFALVDQYNNQISVAKLTAKLEGRSFSTDILSGDGVITGIPFRNLSIEIDAGRNYKPFKEDIPFTKSDDPIIIKLEKKASTTLSIPPFDNQMKLYLIALDQEKIQLESSTDVDVLLEKHTLQIEYQGETLKRPVEIQAGQTEILLPWAYSIVDEKGNTLHADVSFEQKTISLNEYTSLELPDSPEIQIQGEIKALEAGEAKIIDVDLGAHPAYGLHKEITKSEKRIKSAKTKNIAVGGAAALTTLIAGSFQLQSNAAAAEARDIDDPDDLDDYEEFVALSGSKQNLAFGGYASMGISYSLLGWMVLDMQKQQSKLRKNKQLYDEKLQEPITFEER